jgi:NhaP-type Na+/H+ and K+/H+ antiporters
VLFSDASSIDLRALRRGASVPLRLLGIGLPLTIAVGALAAAVIFGELTFWEAVIVGVVLAPTDAALGQAVVTEPRVPTRIRQGLNVESGLNDGICVPLLFAAVAAADVQSGISGGTNGVHPSVRGGRLRDRRRGGRRAGGRSRGRLCGPRGI